MVHPIDSCCGASARLDGNKASESTPWKMAGPVDMLEYEALVEPSLGVRSGRPDVQSELVDRLRTDSVVRVIYPESDSDMDARRDGFCDQGFFKYGLYNLNSQVFSRTKDSSIGRGTELDGLCEHSDHGTSENGDESKQFHEGAYFIHPFAAACAICDP